MKRDMARKRQLDVNKQERKKQLIKELWHGAEELLDNPVFIGKLVKGKIHCSCPMCASKTNGAGKVYTYGWKASDKKKMVDISEQVMEEYKEAYIELAK